MSQTKAQLVSPIGILTAIGVNVSGIVTSNRFVGNGSGLTGISTSSFDPAVSINTTGIVTASSFSSPGGLTINGDVTAVNFRSTSDISLKENVSDIENSLEIVSQLRGVSFNWKENGVKSYGVIAQELEEVLPELVSDTDPKTVYYDALIGILIESIKELKSEVETLKNTK